MAQPTLRELLEAAQHAAYLAGKRTLAHFNTGVQVDIKGDNTPVTVADREAERVIRDYLAATYPTHAILGEEEGETGKTAGDQPYRWIVDPIDGTKAFVAGVPLYGTLIGVEVEGVPSVGVIYLPALGDMVAAANGLGCTWNGRPCRASSVGRLDDALVVTSSIVRCQKRSNFFEQLTSATRQQRTWGDAFGYALIATGRAEIMLDPACSPWDVAPMLPIMREAGGNFTDWRGVASVHNGDGVATNGLLHSQVLDLMATEPDRNQPQDI